MKENGQERRRAYEEEEGSDEEGKGGVLGTSGEMGVEYLPICVEVDIFFPVFGPTVVGLKKRLNTVDINRIFTEDSVQLSYDVLQRLQCWNYFLLVVLPLHCLLFYRQVVVLGHNHF